MRKNAGESFVPQYVDAMGEQLLGARIKDLRLRKKWSHADLASRAGVDKSHIWKIEEGVFSNPRLATLTKIASAFEISVEDLTAVRERPKVALDSRLLALAVKIGELPPRDRQLVIEFLERVVAGLFATPDSIAPVFGHVTSAAGPRLERSPLDIAERQKAAPVKSRKTKRRSR